MFLCQVALMFVFWHTSYHRSPNVGARPPQFCTSSTRSLCLPWCRSCATMHFLYCIQTKYKHKHANKIQTKYKHTNIQISSTRSLWPWCTAPTQKLRHNAPPALHYMWKQTYKNTKVRTFKHKNNNIQNSTAHWASVSPMQNFRNDASCTVCNTPKI